MHALNELNWVCQSTNDPNNNQSNNTAQQLANQLNANTGGILLSNTVELVAGGDDLVANNLLNTQPQMSVQVSAGESDLVQQHNNSNGKVFGSNRGITFVKYPNNTSQQFQANNQLNGHLNGQLSNGQLANNLTSNLASQTAFNNSGAYNLLHQSVNSLGAVSNSNSNSSTLSSSSSNNSLNYTNLNLSHNSSSGGTSPLTQLAQLNGQQSLNANNNNNPQSNYAYSTGNGTQLTYNNFDQLMANSIPTPSPEWITNSPQHSPEQQIHHQTILNHHQKQIAQQQTYQFNNHNSPQHHVNLPTPPSNQPHTQLDSTNQQFQQNRNRHYNPGNHYNYPTYNQNQQRQQVSFHYSGKNTIESFQQKKTKTNLTNHNLSNQYHTQQSQLHLQQQNHYQPQLQSDQSHLLNNQQLLNAQQMQQQVNLQRSQSINMYNNGFQNSNLLQTSSINSDFVNGKPVIQASVLAGKLDSKHA